MGELAEQLGDGIGEGIEKIEDGVGAGFQSGKDFVTSEEMKVAVGVGGVIVLIGVVYYFSTRR